MRHQLQLVPMGLVIVASWLSAPCEAQTTTRVSVASDGTEGNNDSRGGAVSENCRYVAFDSVADNLVPDDTNEVCDIFIHDRVMGATVRVGLSDDEVQPNGDTWVPRISATGRYVAFKSKATNLVPGDVNGVEDVFVRDWVAGETTIVSVASDGTQANIRSLIDGISSDGRFVAFHTVATNLVPDDLNGVYDVFVHDLQTRETSRVSVAADGTEANYHSLGACLSPDGRYAGFESWADNLVPGDTNGLHDVFVKDRQTGAIDRVSIASDGGQANGHSGTCSFNRGGRYVVFISGATNLVPDDTNGLDDVFVHDRQTGENVRVNVSSDGEQANDANWSRAWPMISADGMLIAFSSLATNLVPNDTNGGSDVFTHNRLTRETVRVSIVSDGSQGNASSVFVASSSARCGVGFASQADNLVPNDGNGVWDFFVHDLGWIFTDGFESADTSGWSSTVQ